MPTNWLTRKNRYYDGPVSDHYDGARFFNPHHPRTDRTLLQVMRWQLGGHRPLWPNPSQTAVNVIPENRVEHLRCTLVGHASVLVQLNGLNLLTDPVWSNRASPLRLTGPKRVDEPAIALENLPRIDAVLVSHNHYDHLDVATLAELERRFSPMFVTPLGNDTILRGVVPRANIVTGDWNEMVGIGDVEIHIVPAYHWSARTISDRRMALWGGFMIRSGSRSCYFAGDTGYGDGAIFRQMRRDFGPPDVALLPIGGYAPRWFMSAQHSDPEEAVAMMIDLGAKRGLGIHWGCFRLTDEPYEEPPALLALALERHGIKPEHFPAARTGDVFDYS